MSPTAAYLTAYAYKSTGYAAERNSDSGTTEPFKSPRLIRPFVMIHAKLARTD